MSAEATTSGVCCGPYTGTVPPRKYRSLRFGSTLLLLLCASVARSESTLPSETIHRSSQRVMEHRDFRSVRRRVLEEIPVNDMDKGFLEGLLDDLGTGIADFFSWLFPPRAPGPAAPPAPVRSPPSNASSFWADLDLARGAAILAIVTLIIALIVVLSRLIRRHQQDPNRGGIPSLADSPTVISVPPGELAAMTYETRAVEFAGQGQFSQAIRELLLGSMSWIERAGLIRFRKGLTNRDYLRAVWRLDDKRTAYDVTGREFELVFFGRRTATADMFNRCLTAFKGAFHEEDGPLDRDAD